MDTSTTTNTATTTVEPPTTAPITAPIYTQYRNTYIYANVLAFNLPIPCWSEFSDFKDIIIQLINNYCYL